MQLLLAAIAIVATLVMWKWIPTFVFIGLVMSYGLFEICLLAYRAVPDDTRTRLEQLRFHVKRHIAGKR